MTFGSRFFQYRSRAAIWLLGLVLSMYGLAATAEEEPTAPSVLIESLFKEMNQRLQADQQKIAEDQQYLLTVGEEVLGPYVAFDRMAQRILGKHWRDITAEQRERYTQAFKNRVAVTLASQYDPSIDYGLAVLGERRNSKGNQAIVRSEVTDNNSGKKYTIDYSFLFSSSEQRWMVYDISVEGVSVLQSFRTATAEDFSRYGIEHLISQLEKGEGEVMSKPEG